jgi:hypothetical protein
MTEKRYGGILFRYSKKTISDLREYRVSLLE